MVIDLDECTGCDLCVIACKDEHVGNSHLPWASPQPDTGHFWIRVDSTERGQVPKVRVSYLPLLCVQCDNAPCMKACPDDAIAKREDGTVLIDPAKCSGCRLCQEACPYGVIYFNEQLNIAQKCTWCAHITEKGGIPRCVDACPRDAMVFLDEDDPKMRRLKVVAEDFHPEYGTRPRVGYVGLPKPFIAGTTVDPATKEVIAGAKVVAIDLFNDKQTAVLTDGFGDFWLKGLERGHRYALEVGGSGYAKSRLVVTADTDRNLGDIHLKTTSPRVASASG